MKIADNVVQAGKGITYDQKKGSICVPEITGQAKRQFYGDSRMEEMDDKDGMIRHRVYVIHDLLLEKCQGRMRPSV